MFGFPLLIFEQRLHILRDFGVAFLAHAVRFSGRPIAVVTVTMFEHSTYALGVCRWYWHSRLLLVFRPSGHYGAVSIWAAIGGQLRKKSPVRCAA